VLRLAGARQLDERDRLAMRAILMADPVASCMVASRIETSAWTRGGWAVSCGVCEPRGFRGGRLDSLCFRAAVPRAPPRADQLTKRSPHTTEASPARSSRVFDFAPGTEPRGRGNRRSTSSEGSLASRSTGSVAAVVCALIGGSYATSRLRRTKFLQIKEADARIRTADPFITREVPG
jgi:hypothetical protein